LWPVAVNGNCSTIEDSAAVCAASIAPDSHTGGHEQQCHVTTATAKLQRFKKSQSTLTFQPSTFFNC